MRWDHHDVRRRVVLALRMTPEEVQQRSKPHGEAPWFSPVVSFSSARFSTLRGRTLLRLAGRVGSEIVVAKRAGSGILGSLCPQDERGNWPEMTIQRAVDLAWFGPRWNAKSNGQGRGQQLVGARSARGGDLAGALAPKLPPPPTGRYPSDVSGAACPTRAAARRSGSACHGSFVRTCRSGCPAAPKPGGSSASTSVWRPGLRRLGRRGHLCRFDKIIGLDLSEACVDGSFHKAPIVAQARARATLTGQGRLALVSCSLGTKPWLTNLANSAAAVICSVLPLPEIALVVAPTFPQQAGQIWPSDGAIRASLARSKNLSIPKVGWFLNLKWADFSKNMNGGLDWGVKKRRRDFWCPAGRVQDEQVHLSGENLGFY